MGNKTTAIQEVGQILTSGVVSSTRVGSCTFMEIDHEIISTTILLSSTDSRRVVVHFKRKYVHELLVNGLVKLAQENSVVKLTDRPDMTIAVDWGIKQQNKQTNKILTWCMLYLKKKLPKISKKEKENFCLHRSIHVHVCFISFNWLLCRFEPHRRHCVVSLSKNINPSLVLVQPRKTRPFITERLLMGRKETNQTNKQIDCCLLSCYKII